MIRFCSKYQIGFYIFFSVCEKYFLIVALAVIMASIGARHSFLKTTSLVQRIFKRDMITRQLKNGDKSITVNIRNLVEKDIPEIKELRIKHKFFDPVSLYSLCLEMDPTSLLGVEDENGKILGILSNFKGIDNWCVAGLRTVYEDYRTLGLTSKVLVPFALTLLGNRTIITVTEAKQYQFHSKRLPHIMQNFTYIDFESVQEVDSEKLSSHVPPGVEVQKFDDSHLVSILAYDHQVTGLNREAMVKFICRDPFSKTFIAILNDKCVGYGVLKLDVQGGRKVGPLYADNPEIAEAVLKKLLESSKSADGLCTTVLSNNAPALLMIEKLGEMKKLICYVVCTENVSWPVNSNIYSPFEIEIMPI